MVAPSRLLVGLGNPGERYAATRHNLGFRVVDALAARRGVALRREECAARIEDAGGLLLAQPQTFMNRSGYSVRCLCERYGIAPAAALVVYDDVALPFGRLRLRGSGGAGGHRGMESVIDNLRTDEVPRLRLGIAPQPPAPPEPDAGEASAAPAVDLAEFVLAPFAPGESGAVDELVARAADAVELWLVEGLAAAASRYNTGDLPAPERLV